MTDDIDRRLSTAASTLRATAPEPEDAQRAYDRMRAAQSTAKNTDRPRWVAGVAAAVIVGVVGVGVIAWQSTGEQPSTVVEAPTAPSVAPSTEREPVGTDVPATSPAPTSSAPATSSAPTSSPARAAIPRFEFDLPDATPDGPLRRFECCTDRGPDDTTYHYAWGATSGIQDGLLLLDLDPNPSAAGIEGDYIVEDLPAPDGRAALLIGNTDEPPPPDGYRELWWDRASGEQWRFESTGLTAERLATVAFGAVAGEGRTVNLLDDEFEPLTTDAEGVIETQTYAIATEFAGLSVGDVATMFDVFAVGVSIVPAVIAGTPGYISTLNSGQTIAVWDAGDGWWASANLAPALGGRSAEILASIVRV